MLKVVGASWIRTTTSLLFLLSILIFGIFLIIFVKYRAAEDDGKYSGTVYWNPYTEGFDIYLWGQNNKPDEISKGVARAYYQPCMQETGWAILEIETNGDYSDKIQAFGAGILEGSLSWQHIYWQWTNTIQQPCLARVEFCNEIRNFLRNNTNFVRKKAIEKEKTDPFWHQVDLFYVQLDGIEFGWRYEMKKNHQEYEIPKVDFLWMNMISDFKQFEKLSGQNYTETTPSPVAMTLLKLLSNNSSDFLLAHASSGLYNSMLRVQKKYRFHYHLTAKSNSKLVPGQTISFTSYPASVHSQDDFYQIIMQENLNLIKITVTGTALNLNGFKAENLKNQVLLGPRVMAANRLSKDGKAWSNFLKMSNNVFGSKQWMHIVTQSNELRFWVLEQTHLKTVSRNERNMLQKQGFWIHCGIPHYQGNLRVAGNANQNNVSYSEIPVDSIAVDVEKVLKSGQNNITNLISLINLIRGPHLSLVGRTDLHIANTNEFATFADVADNSTNVTESEPEKLTSKNISYYKNDDSYKISKNVTWLQVFLLQKVVSIAQPLRTKYEAILMGEKGTKHGRKVQNNAKNKTFSSVNGIIDLKVTKNNEKFLAAAGPPFNVDDKTRVIKPFQWSKSKISYLPHNGHSDVWNYEPLVANFVWT